MVCIVSYAESFESPRELHRREEVEKFLEMTCSFLYLQDGGEVPVSLFPQPPFAPKQQGDLRPNAAWGRLVGTPYAVPVTDHFR
jgi:hypothetical protein